jgi:putative FmdB family regulatory protein
MRTTFDTHTVSKFVQSAGRGGATAIIARPLPIYEYRCENGHTFEAFQKMTDDPIAACEVCGAPVERVFHPIAVHFKGSGFYTTDYAKKKAPAKAGGDGSSGESGGESGADSGGSEKSEAGKSSDSISSTGSGDSAKASSAD